ncbi:MAG: DEAD/DEAH box helicase [Epsilonproteobacteria bacterium]|nr:DEAD/DEAH box helicase [Campylobacterota bacterium]
MQAKIYEFLKEATLSDKTLLVTKNDKESFDVRNVCEYFGYKVYTLPDIRINFGEDLRAYKHEFDELISSMSGYFFDNSKKKIVVSPFSTVLNPLPSRELFKRLEISFADTVDIDKLKETLFFWGYEFVDIVQERGEVSFRGDIIDIFPINHDNPIRISLFDDECESIRHFECETQKSFKEELEKVQIIQANFAFDKSQYEKVKAKISNIQSDSFVKDVNSLGLWGLEEYAKYYPEVFDAYLCGDILDEFEEAKSFNSDIKDIFDYLQVINTPKKYKDIQVLNINDFIEFHHKKSIKILCKNEAIYKSSSLKEEYKKYIDFSPLVVNVMSDKEVILSLNKRVVKKRSKVAKIVLDELNVGDYVVHEDYGIGVFKGLQSAVVLGAKRDFIKILYQNDDKLLLPVENIDKIDRYISDSGTLAVVDKLGRGSFAKLKEKVKEKLFEIAKEIVEMAAKRELESAPVIKTDFEEIEIFQKSSGFIYTKDQIETIKDIFDDFNSSKIMDRLLSGDVGFGKTEVAMNAIFATVKNGFQAAMVVPTTLLSNQHYKTLQDRFEKFGIKVYRLDRFVSAKLKKETLQKISSGEAQVVVGTHALFSAKFKNLAFLVIDEEHKFGVKQKEKLKELKKDVHILSMSATPIPRSLNMALSSIKKFSQLTTPPLEKKGVRTFVKEFGKPIIKEVILREIRRGGQIFFVHNRIATLAERKRYLQEILPNIKILSLHSKITAADMEKEMLAFANKEYDVLLSTSIVESGIHLPNVNTMIVENADKFGIADLHQLRGRVGRGKNEGYCYLLVENKETLSELSKKRLIALESNSFLGSGSVLAYHDLQIRGGGNLIGKAQSGHIKNIGYAQYLRMLEDSINRLLNKKMVKKQEINIKLNVSAYINEEYISEDRLRLEVYRRLGKCEELHEVYEIEDELEDRFGKMDDVTRRFLDIICIKIKAYKNDVVLISNYQQNISFTFADAKKRDFKARSKDDDDVIEAVLRELK